MTIVLRNRTGSEAVGGFSVAEVDLTGGVRGVFGVVGDHDDCLAFGVERFE